MDPRRTSRFVGGGLVPRIALMVSVVLLLGLAGACSRRAAPSPSSHPGFASSSVSPSPRGFTSSSVIAPPLGFAVSLRAGVLNGPVSPATLDRLTGMNNATQIGFVAGYDQNYDSTTSSDSLVIHVMTFKSVADVARYEELARQVGSTPGQTITSVPGVPTAVALNSSTPDSDGVYWHAIFVAKGDRFLFIDYAAHGAGSIPLLGTIALAQYPVL